MEDHRLTAEREALVQVIDAAFGHVDREGGVSWSESRVLDGNGTDRQRTDARAKDEDRSWRDLVDDDAWDPEMGVGGWSFLDAIGFRYYLPAALTRSLREGFDVDIQSHLTLSKGAFRSLALEQWSALDPGQCYAVARYLRFRIALDFNNESWRRAYRSYWASLPAPIGEP